MRFGHVLLGIVLPLGLVGCGRKVVEPAPAPAPSAAADSARAPKPARSARAPRPKSVVRRVDSTRLEAALLRERAHAPLAYVLGRRSGNHDVADRAAAAVLREAQRLRLSASLVAAVMLVENTPLDTTAESIAGAVGLMQVMPVHGGAHGCDSAELVELEANICHGTRVLHMYLRRSRTVQYALRRYNGCVGSLTTRSCLRYPARVLRTASRVRREMLAAPAVERKEPPPEPPYFLRRRE